MRTSSGRLTSSSAQRTRMSRVSPWSRSPCHVLGAEGMCRLRHPRRHDLRVARPRPTPGVRCTAGASRCSTAAASTRSSVRRPGAGSRPGGVIQTDPDPPHNPHHHRL
jgi:hypothetical protein